MATGDQLVIRAVPLAGGGIGYLTASAQSIEITSAVATFNGAGAAGSFVPALAFYNSDGTLLARTVANTTVAAGSSAEVSFFPFVLQSSGGGGTSSLTVTDGVTPVASVTTLDFTSGATVTAGAAGVANVAVTGGGFVPNPALGQYTVAPVSIASNGSSNGSFAFTSGTALLNLTTPTLPSVTARGVYAMMANFQGDAAFNEGFALWAHAFMNGLGGSEAFQAPQTQSTTIGPLGSCTVIDQMNAGDTLGVTLTNRDTAARSCEWNGITIVRLFTY